MHPTSEPGAKPDGIVWAHPVTPLDATQSMLGCLATSSGVLLPSSLIGTSATPSGKITTYFIGTCRKFGMWNLECGMKTKNSEFPIPNSQLRQISCSGCQRSDPP